MDPSRCQHDEADDRCSAEAMTVALLATAPGSYGLIAAW